MLARPYSSKSLADAAALDRIFAGRSITDPAVDSIFLAGSNTYASGVLVYRPGAFIHELECGHGPRARLRADALANYAIAHARGTPQVLRTAIFLVKGENVAMQRWAEAQPGMVKQSDPGDVLYTLTPP